MAVLHQPEQRRFVVDVGDSQGVLEYRLLADSAVDFTHTYVPFRLRGKGYAEALVAAGLDWARQQGLQVQASCWYVAKAIA